MVQDIRDIKGPLSFPPNLIPLYIVGALILCAGAYLLIRRLRKRHIRVDAPAAAVKPAHQIAYERLEALRTQNLPAQGRIKEYYFELADIVRRYIEDRFRIRAPEMTTEEFLSTLKDSDALKSSHKELVGEFLVLCDVVKFAKYGPTQKEVEESFKAAVRLVDETKADQDVQKVDAT